jgi:hypothetical protein
VNFAERGGIEERNVFRQGISIRRARVQHLSKAASTPPPKPDGWSSASNGTTPQSTAVGSIWRSPNSASYRPSASTAGIPDKTTLVEEIAAWEHDRNANNTKTSWHFCMDRPRVASQK